MEFFAFTEMPYPDVPEEYWNSARVTLPNGLYDEQRRFLSARLGLPA